MRTILKALGLTFTSYPDGWSLRLLAFEIVYVYTPQFPEAVWTKLPLNVAHKETEDFNEKSLRKFTC